MKKKPATIIAVSALLLLAILAVAWGSASAAYVNDKSMVFGNQGIFVPAGLDQDNYSLTRISPSQYRGASIDFKRPLMDLEIHSQGHQINIPYSMTYVFYSLHQSEVKQWDKGELSLYYKDLTTGIWTTCPTVAVASSANKQSTYTLACVAPQATLFGLGKRR